MLSVTPKFAMDWKKMGIWYFRDGKTVRIFLSKMPNSRLAQKNFKTLLVRWIIRDLMMSTSRNLYAYNIAIKDFSQLLKPRAKSTEINRVKRETSLARL